MHPSAFEQANSTMDTPEGMSPDKVEPLRVFRDGRYVVSCWKPTQDEIEEIVRTGRVWVWVLGDSMPPISVMGKTPWPELPQEP